MSYVCYLSNERPSGGENEDRIRENLMSHFKIFDTKFFRFSRCFKQAQDEEPFQCRKILGACRLYAYWLVPMLQESVSSIGGNLWEAISLVFACKQIAALELFPQ